MTTPIYINNRNRLTSLQAMLVYLAHVPDAIPIVVDNESTYPPLLDFYCDSRVEMIPAPNLGPRAPWDSGAIPTGDIHRKRHGSEYYVVTDSDLDLSCCPFDLLEVLAEGLNRYRDYPKCGLSMETADLPDCYPFRERVQAHEAQFWTQPLDDCYFAADVETTFALYRCDNGWGGYRATRTNRPYVARHVPWYIDPRNLTAEEDYYLKHATAPGPCWTPGLKVLVEEIKAGLT